MSVSVWSGLMLGRSSQVTHRFTITEFLHLIMTTRDKVWFVTVAKLTNSETFRTGEMPLDESEIRTGQRVWSWMESAGLLARDGRAWRKTERLDVLLSEGLLVTDEDVGRIPVTDGGDDE